jgi:uncharacterized protein YndB with AHSA1/START domain
MTDYTTSVDIEAPPALVFEHLVDPGHMVAWMGERAELEPVQGGGFAVDINGTPIRGQYLEVDPPRRVVVSWGVAGNAELPPGATRVEFHPGPDRLGHPGRAGAPRPRRAVGVRPRPGLDALPG